jgi:hypothetical protein
MTAAKKGPPESWAGTVRAIGIRALSTGKFWQFCCLVVLVWWVWQIKSEHWVEIARLFLVTQFYAGLGWVLFAISVIFGVFFHRAQRSMYLLEIDRISEEKTKLQEKLIPHAKPSKYKPK